LEELVNPGTALVRNQVTGADLFQIIGFTYTRAQEQVMPSVFSPCRAFLPAFVHPLLTARAGN
jgi:hypothetical protein